jgi:hypothetical protein
VSEEKRFFFEKKKQKTFSTLGHGRRLIQRPRPGAKEVFCRAFFQKSAYLP